MGLFENLSKQQQIPNNESDINALYARFQQNPMEFLIRSGLNIPDSVSDPRALLDHLARTNQVPRQYQQAVNRILGR